MESGDAGTIATLDELVEDAARQRLHLLGWEMDRQLAKSGWKTIYSIDTDIIKVFLDPVSEAVTGFESGRGRRQGYTQIFRDDPRELTIELGRAISEFVFFRLEKRSAIVILYPLEREVGNVFQAIAVAADSEHRDALTELSRVRQNIEEFLSRLSAQPSDEERLDTVIGAMPQLHNLLFGHSGPSAQLTRFSVLLERSSLTDFDQFLTTDNAVHSGVADRLRERDSVRGWIEFSHLEGLWEDRIRPLKSARIPQRNILADCRALARLEQLNTWLNPIDVRVVHVTGDRAILEAATQYHPSDDGPSFAELYLRNPRSFLAEPSVLFTEEGRESGMAEEVIPWLDVFLAQFTGDEHVSARNLLAFLELSPDERRSVVQGVLEQDPTAGDSFAKQWSRFTGPITLDHVSATHGEAEPPGRQFLKILSDWAQQSGVSDRERLQDETRIARKLLGRFEQALGDLEGLVVDRVLETWKDCFAAATSTGFSLVRFGAEGEMPPRTAVPIAFAEFHTARRFFSAMLGEGQERRYREMIEALESEDDTGYLFYLAFGALFGAQGKWRVAQILADRALETVGEPAVSAPPPRITGREAYYLRSVARRLTARSLHDLDDAEIDLNRARAALRESREGVPNHPITDVRFDAEKIALDLSRYLFLTFAGEEPEWTAGPEILADLQRRIQVLLGRAEVELDGRHRERVRTALLVNSLSCLMLARKSEFATSGHPHEEGAYREVYEELRRSMTGHRAVRIEHSYLHSAVFLAARELFEPAETRAERRNRLVELEVNFDEEMITSQQIAAYDRRRFRFLRDFAMDMLNSRVRRGARDGSTPRPTDGE